MISSFIPGLSFSLSILLFLPSPKSPHTIPAIFSFSLINFSIRYPVARPFFYCHYFAWLIPSPRAHATIHGYNSFSFFYHHPNLPCDDRQTRPEIEHLLSYVPDDPVDYATDVLAPARKTSNFLDSIICSDCSAAAIYEQLEVRHSRKCPLHLNLPPTLAFHSLQQPLIPFSITAPLITSLYSDPNLPLSNTLIRLLCGMNDHSSPV